jgi:hypothetical protein
LLEVLLQGLDIKIIDDLSKHSQSICLVHLILYLCYILCQLGDDHEDLILLDFEFLSRVK